MKKMKLFLATLAVAGILPLAACQHTVVGALDTENYAVCVENPDQCGVTPEAMAFAVIADFNRVKAAAATYAELPTTSVEEIDFILMVIREADAEIIAFGADVEANAGISNSALRVAGVARSAGLRLSTRLAIAGVTVVGGSDLNLVKLLQNR